MFSADSWSFIKSWCRGHEVPAYTHGTLNYGQAALEMFTQVMNGNGITST